MTAHLRARAIQAGALLALVSGMLAVASSPAFADGPEIAINNPPRTVPSGGSAELNYTVTNTGGDGTTEIDVIAGNMRCSGACSTPQAQIAPGQTVPFKATLTAPQVPAGQVQTVRLIIRADMGGGLSATTQPITITIRGADRPQTVRQVNGRVKDEDGKPVPGANVGIQDSQGHQQRGTTNNDGRFAFISSDANPILAGNISVGALKEGYKAVTVNVQGTSGSNINVPLTLQADGATASASPSVSASASLPAEDEATDPAVGDASPPAGDTQNAAQNSDGGSGSLLFIILGGLLVAAGVGAIVLVMMRRKNAGDDPNELDGAPAAGNVMATNRYGGADPTRIAAPVGGRMPDATMVAGRQGPSISDAPTMMQRAVPIEDEFPDPYGAPAVTQGAYGAAGAYGAGAAGAYGAAAPYGGPAYGGAPAPGQPAGYDAGPPTQYGRPPAPEADPYGAYGAPAGGDVGYGAEQPRYDEPTGMYRPESSGYGGGQEPGYGGGGQEPGYGGGGQEPGYGGGGQEPGYGTGNAYRGNDYGPDYQPPRGESTGAYPGGNGGYQGGGYGGQEQQPEQGGYGSWGAPAGGIDSGNGYGPPAGGGTYGGGGYGSPAGGGTGPVSNPGSYGAQAGGTYGGRPGDQDYGDQGGYDPRATYGRADPAYDRGGPPAPGGGYGAGEDGAGQYGGGQYGDGGAPGGGYYGGSEPGGGRHGGQSRQQEPGQRRPLDWLDD